MKEKEFKKLLKADFSTALHQTMVKEINYKDKKYIFIGNPANFVLVENMFNIDVKPVNEDYDFITIDSIKRLIAKDKPYKRYIFSNYINKQYFHRISMIDRYLLKSVNKFLPPYTISGLYSIWWLMEEAEVDRFYFDDYKVLIPFEKFSGVFMSALTDSFDKACFDEEETVFINDILPINIKEERK